MWKKIVKTMFCLVPIVFCLLGCKKQDELVRLEDLDNPKSAESKVQEDCVKEASIYVHVCGAVKNPGVVELTECSRAFDAVQAAGGFRQDARQDSVNLAAMVTDGEKLYIPTQEEAESLKVSQEMKDSGLIDLNAADAELLCTLPGIGESRAAEIIAYREANGGFRMIEEIMNVPGIKESIFRKLENLITAK